MSKLILTNEVSGLGSAGDVVEVKNAHRGEWVERIFINYGAKGGILCVGYTSEERSKLGYAYNTIYWYHGEWRTKNINKNYEKN